MAATDVWTCCQCGTSNFAGNSPDRCPCCSHDKCACCPSGRPGLAQELGFSSTTPADVFGFHRLHTPSFTTDNTYPFGGAASNIGIQDHVRGYHDISQYTYSTNNAAGIGFSDASFVDDECRAYDHGDGSGGQHTYSWPNMAGWWVCHHCKQTNNPALAPVRCSVCGHEQCYSCQVLT